MIADGGGEKRISPNKGRPDIIAIDPTTKTIVVIELKAREAVPKHVKQIQDYMEAIKADTKTKYVKQIQRYMKDPQINGQGPVRGILMASSFTPAAIEAAKKVSKLELWEYSIKFKFKDRAGR